MTKFQAGIVLTSQVMNCQVHAIGKAINPFLQIRSHLYPKSKYIQKTIMANKIDNENHLLTNKLFCSTRPLFWYKTFN